MLNIKIKITVGFTKIDIKL